MNNFNLKSFLTENSLTPNSKLLKEQQLPDATKDLKASEAFKAVGIDMSKPVLVLTQDGGHGEQQTEGTVSAEEALKQLTVINPHMHSNINIITNYLTNLDSNVFDVDQILESHNA